MQKSMQQITKVGGWVPATFLSELRTSDGVWGERNRYTSKIESDVQSIVGHH